MEKLFVTLTLIGFIALASCKKDEISVQETTQQTMESIQDEVEEGQTAESNLVSASKVAADIPQFSNGELQVFAQEYANYFEEIVQADNERDNEKLQQLTTEGMEWSKRAAEWTTKMDEQDAQKWLKWSSRLRTSISAE